MEIARNGTVIHRNQCRITVDIGQPDPNWFFHYDALDERHFKYGEKYLNGGRQCTDLGEYLSRMYIPSNLTKIITEDDFLPFDEAKASLIASNQDYPTFYPPNVVFQLRQNSSDGAHSIVLHWIGNDTDGWPNRWYALRQGREKCPFCDFEGERYKEVGLLNDYCKRKLFEAFEVPEGKIQIENIVMQSPGSLARIGNLFCTPKYPFGDDIKTPEPDDFDQY